MKVMLARWFATFAHWSVKQRRKYTNEPYIKHPEQVVAILMLAEYVDASMICAAWMHDVVEDTWVTNRLIRFLFGQDVASLVEQLTDVSKPEDGNRAIRKALDREHLARAEPRAQSIKYADLISNTMSIGTFDPGFAVKYFKEKEAMLLVMTKGDPKLYKIAQRNCGKSAELIG